MTTFGFNLLIAVVVFRFRALRTRKEYKMILVGCRQSKSCNLSKCETLPANLDAW